MIIQYVTHTHTPMMLLIRPCYVVLSASVSSPTHYTAAADAAGFDTAVSGAVDGAGAGTGARVNRGRSSSHASMTWSEGSFSIGKGPAT